jgi:3-oxoacyl-[acyl-carrier protein] reductase
VNPERAAIITGGSRGIGFAIAQRLASKGYQLTLAARRADQLDAAADRLGPEHVLTVPVDLADPATPAALVEQHVARFGRLDALVVNAGTGTVADLEDLPRQRIDRSIDLNFRSPLLLAQAALPLLRKTGELHASSWVVLLSSITGVLPPRGYAAYGATKAAMISLARSINIEANESGVRAAALCPGYVDTDMTEWIHDKVPRGEMIKAADIAETVDYLLRLSANAVVSEILISRVGAGLTEP